MRCQVDGTSRNAETEVQWTSDPEWGLIHEQVDYHTATGTHLIKVSERFYVKPEEDQKPTPPTKRPGHPGLPRHPALPSEEE
jgi:hypothetical protein